MNPLGPKHLNKSTPQLKLGNLKCWGTCCADPLASMNHPFYICVLLLKTPAKPVLALLQPDRTRNEKLVCSVWPNVQTVNTSSDF